MCGWYVYGRVLSWRLLLCIPHAAAAHSAEALLGPCECCFSAQLHVPAGLWEQKQNLDSRDTAKWREGRVTSALLLQLSTP